MDTCGPGVMGLIADELKPDRNKKPDNFRIELWLRHDFAKEYTTKEAGALASRCNAKGEPLSMYHLSWLLTVGDKVVRTKFENRCLENSLSGKELKRLIQEAAGGRKSGSGRLYDRPKTKTKKGTLLQVEDMADRWLRWHRSLFEKRGKEVESPLLKHLDKQLRDRLEQIKGSMMKIHEIAKAEVAQNRESKVICVGAQASTSRSVSRYRPGVSTPVATGSPFNKKCPNIPIARKQTPSGENARRKRKLARSGER